ncbi:MAG: hypothetical protein COB60_07895 [Flavobacteriaceae bacterium]|nr:MAG: hypothetical protein COB60_07895 [Flavobacteriaceae bacterium]
MVKRTIITGAPGTGKSTLIKGLQSEGILCAEEVSRTIIQKEQLLQSDGMPWKNMQRFSTLVFQETVELFKSETQTQFCDRSLVDVMAYLEHANLPVFEELAAFNFHKYYHKKVFFASPWKEIYCKDPQRPQEFEFQLSLSKCIENLYKKLGFKICYLPCVTPEERILFVLNKSSF